MVKMLFTSWKLTAILFIVYAIGLGAATFVENEYNTSTARLYIYNNPLFYLLQLLMIINFAGVAWKQQLWQNRRYSILVFHLAFVFILLGALITNLFGSEGIMHIREGESSSQMKSVTGVIELPFTIRLNDFNLVRYPGSRSPSSFESELTIFSEKGNRDERIYMNKVIYEQGYRLYQSSYDGDEHGTILTVNDDMPGTIVTYTGYFLLFMGMIVLFFDKRSRFRMLGLRLKELTGVLFLFIFFSFTLSAQSAEHTIPSEQADKWAKLQIQCPTGRIEPVNTYTSKLLRKLYRSERFEDYSPEQVILGIMIDPGYWNNVRLIRLNNKELQELIGVSEKYACFYDLFNADGTYKIASLVGSAYAKPASERSRLEKDLLKLDERINIVYALQQGKMFSLFPFPGDKAGKWYSSGDDISRFSGKDSMFVSKVIPWYLDEAATALKTGKWNTADEIISMIHIYQERQSATSLLTKRQISWELFYNKSRLFFWSALAYLMLGFLLLIFSVSKLLNASDRLNILINISKSFIFLFFLVHTAGIGIRWYISEQAPWSNAYESMIYVSWTTALAGLLFIKRSATTLALGAFFAGIILFVANLNWMDPEITPLVPVLKSYWLMLHVAVITSSYGFFGVSFLLGVLSLVFISMTRRKSNAKLLRKKIKELRIINEMSVYIGVCLLTAGTFLGAIWANESWGRYWGWDPKETWALVTIIVYAFIIHSRFLVLLRSDYAFSVMTIFGLASVLMTYFGVNYYLTGLHSYGGGETPPALNILFVVYGLILFLVMYAGYIVRRTAD